MTDLIKKENKVNYLSKKARQSALQEKIDQIDAELKSIGVGDIKYRITGAITHLETPQNSINIQGITDLSLLFRILALYENQLECKKRFEKNNQLPKDFLLKQQNGYLVTDIIHDLNLRILTLTNQERINILTQSKAKLLPFLNEESRFINALKEIDTMLKNANK